MTPAKQWAGVMAPYVAYCFGFNMRMKELRLGHHGYSVSSRAGNEEKTPDGLGRVSKFGLEPRHHVLLEGCTFPPEIQSSMAQTLGSMTVCIKLATSTSSGIYTKKYEDAIERSFKHQSPPYHREEDRQSSDRCPSVCCQSVDWKTRRFGTSCSSQKSAKDVLPLTRISILLLELRRDQRTPPNCNGGHSRNQAKLLQRVQPLRSQRRSTK